MEGLGTARIASRARTCFVVTLQLLHTVCVPAPIASSVVADTRCPPSITPYGPCVHAQYPQARPHDKHEGQGPGVGLDARKVGIQMHVHNQKSSQLPHRG